MERFSAGDAIIFPVTFTDSAGALSDPSSTWGRVWDANSTVVASLSSLAAESTGKFSGTWQSSLGTPPGPFAFEGAGLMGTLVFRRRAILGEIA